MAAGLTLRLSPGQSNLHKNRYYFPQDGRPASNIAAISPASRAAPKIASSSTRPWRFRSGEARCRGRSPPWTSPAGVHSHRWIQSYALTTPVEFERPFARHHPSDGEQPTSAPSIQSTPATIAQHAIPLILKIIIGKKLRAGDHQYPPISASRHHITHFHFTVDHAHLCTTFRAALILVFLR